MENNKIIIPAIIALGLIISTWILGSAFKNRNATEDSISVVGLGSKDFISDEISWSGEFSTHAADAKTAYSIINTDKEKVKQFFLSKGFSTNEFSFGGVNFSKSFRTITIENNGNYEKTESIFDGYNATQTVTFSSKKNPELMKKIENIIDKTSELINSGIEFNPNAVQYTYSDLPSLKHSLIEKASQDARERAQKITGTAKGSLGKLKNASMGVFQITGQGSVEEDSYGGNLDTYSKAKTARITVRLEYQLD
ncbi:MAG: SIMPL domain-containing protein [Chitinophagaceae bacterium]|nr:SIMPL domain-containing protein [Chitinophagaceae bacterium]